MNQVIPKAGRLANYLLELMMIAFMVSRPGAGQAYSLSLVEGFL